MKTPSKLKQSCWKYKLTKPLFLKEALLPLLAAYERETLHHEGQVSHTLVLKKWNKQEIYTHLPIWVVTGGYFELTENYKTKKAW